MVMPADEIFCLTSEVLNVTSETSDNFVPAPSKDSILSDLIIGLGRFRNTVRWKWFFTEEKRKKNEKLNSPLSQNTLNSEFSFNNYNSENDTDHETEDKEIHKGLKSGLKLATTTQNAPIASPDVEAFLKDVEKNSSTKSLTKNYPGTSEMK